MRWQRVADQSRMTPCALEPAKPPISTTRLDARAILSQLSRVTSRPICSALRSLTASPNAKLTRTTWKGPQDFVQPSAERRNPLKKGLRLLECILGKSRSKRGHGAFLSTAALASCSGEAPGHGSTGEEYRCSPVTTESFYSGHHLEPR